MADLRLYLLGPPRVELDEVPIMVKPRKALALLIYLAVTAEHHTRDFLATLLWPDSGASQARRSLRNRLSELKRALGPEWIAADRESVGLQAGFWLDVAEFQKRLNDIGDAQNLAAAAALYRADFLSGFTLPDCPGYDEWQFFQTEGLRQSLAAALDKLIAELSESGEWETAVFQAQRRLALDSLHEPAQRQLMMLYARSGQQAAALRQYDLCRQTLADELDLEPAAETTELYRQILNHEFPLPTAETHPRHNLPIQTTNFIGRKSELAEIRSLLLTDSDCRLLNLVGPGGIGKTRLALAAAAQVQDAFPDGVFFIPFAPIAEPQFIIPAMASALRFNFFGESEPKEQLLDYLRHKELLLVLDNFEHLLAGAGLLSEILGRAAHVVVLATSRERFNLREEWVFEVRGLSYPLENSPGADPGQLVGFAERYSAVNLFLQRSRQSETAFSPTADDLAAIIRICRLVEGMPLGLELAASWTRTLSCGEIAAEIENSIEFLTTSLRNIPQRHRSLVALFEQTWDRLAHNEQQVLSRMAVFRGGCTREAAQTVTGAALPILSSLIDKALLRRTNTGRFELHELIRQFAQSKLETDARALERIQQRHRDFFTNFLAARTQDVKGRRQGEALAEIEADLDNVRLAWRGAAADQDVEAIERSADCLFVYYLYRNGYDEGQTEFRRAAAALSPLTEAQLTAAQLPAFAVSAENVNLVAFLLAALGYFVAHRRNLQKGQLLLEETLAFLRRSKPLDRKTEAFTLLWLGWAHYFRGQLSAGAKTVQESFSSFKDMGDLWAQGWALTLWGNCVRDGYPAKALQIYRQGSSITRAGGDQIVRSYLILNTGNAARILGRYKRAKTAIDEAVIISQNFHNILGLGYSYLTRGRLAINLGLYKEATQTINLALNYLNKMGTVHASVAQVDLARTYHLQGALDPAEQLYRQALAGFEASHSSLAVSRCLNWLGCLLLDRGALQGAEQCQRDSLAILQESEPKPALLAAALLYLGQVLVAAGPERWPEARESLRQALELITENQLAPLALELCVAAVPLLEQEGQRDQALDMLALAAGHESATADIRQKARYALSDRRQLSSPDIQTNPDPAALPEMWPAVQKLHALLAERRRP